MKKYFLYELKKNAFAIGCLALASTVLYCVPVLTSSNFMLGGASRTFVWIISLIGGLLAGLVPIWTFSYKMKGRSVDLFYSLPLSHVKILTVKFLVGLIAVFAPYTVAYWLGAFSAMARAFDEMNAVYYIPQYFASLIPVYFIYSISAFAYTRANRIIDGIVFIVFWAFAVALLAFALKQLTYSIVVTGYDEYSDTVLHTYNYYVFSNHYLPFAPLDYLTTHFQQHIAGYLNIHAYPPEKIELANIIVGFSITALMSAGATAGLFLTEKRTKAENVGQISESWFGYKTMIPFYTVCLEGICSSVALFVMVIVCSFFLTVAYKRSFKIGKWQAIILSASAVAGIILGVLIQCK